MQNKILCDTENTKLRKYSFCLQDFYIVCETYHNKDSQVLGRRLKKGENLYLI